jgi:4a-hydroxytetrahydrobiopterin dehydratase
MRRFFSTSPNTIKKVFEIRNITPLALTDSQIKIGMQKFGLGEWSFRTDGDRNVIGKNLQFENFRTAWDFMSIIAVGADMAEHHPEWFHVYNQVNIIFSTHDCKGVSVKDLLMAKMVEDVLKNPQTEMIDTYDLNADITWAG